MKPLISSAELRKIQEAITKHLSEIETTLNLGISKTKVKLSKNGFYYKNKLISLPKLRDDDHSCYVLIRDKLEKVQWFSNETKQMYKLVPTSNRPILQISGTSMHKFPFVERIKADKLTGKILDAGTGLGYTAIVAAETAEQIITVEFDQNVIEMQKLNPYSQELFKRKNIKRLKGDIVRIIKKFSDQEFDFIIFDAGTPRSSGEFFSQNNYQEAYRVLKSGGKMYHYLPKHLITHGRDFAGEVILRLRKLGFELVERNEEGSYAMMKRN